ncbi:hypothetical protein [Legionella sp. PATHC039]|uniref:hypothetical protein n=1 Tax=Legionella sp. PATHC039 TaxID=2992042 RepID=UPI0022446053|nr:hypothetical protein [Legionella sp. PATHC039]MCW8395183.1 hypothetical protein [Legionella sp. PATHC039]
MARLKIVNPGRWKGANPKGANKPAKNTTTNFEYWFSVGVFIIVECIKAACFMSQLD